MYGHSNEYGEVIVTRSHRMIKTFLYNNYVNADLPLNPIRQIDLELWTCPGDVVDVPQGMAIDWAADIAYITYNRCGQIRAYDMKSSLYATVYEDRESRTELIVTVPSERFEDLLPSVSKNYDERLRS